MFLSRVASRYIKSARSTTGSHTCIEERTSLTTRELEDLYQRAWETGYKAAIEDADKEHNQVIEHLNKVPNIF